MIAFGSALRRTLQKLGDRPRSSVWTIVAIACALAVAGGALVAADAIDRASSAPRELAGGSMVVYLADGVDPVQAKQLVDELAKSPGVDKAELVSPADSAKRLERALGADADLLEGVDLASLPGSVEVTLSPGVRDVIAMSPTLRTLRGAPGVDDVVVEAGEHEAPGSATRIAAAALAWPAAILLAALALCSILAILRVRLERDPREAKVLDLLGASPSFSWLPSALAGALLGLAAAIVAAVIVGAAITHFDEVLAWPALVAIASFVGLGMLTGFVGGTLAGAARAPR